MALTEIEIHAAKAVDKPLKLFCGGGALSARQSEWQPLVAVQVSLRREGARHLAGVHPNVSLKRARTGRDEARRLLVDGIDLSSHRQADKHARSVTIKVVAEEWLEQRAKTVAKITLAKARWMLSEFIFPEVRSPPSHKSTAAELLASLRPIPADHRSAPAFH